MYSFYSSAHSRNVKIMFNKLYKKGQLTLGMKGSDECGMMPYL